MIGRVIVAVVAMFLAVSGALAFSLGRSQKAGAATKEHRIALVIGNARYPGNPLKNPVNDARTMAQALRSLGFDVIERTDVTQKELNRSITQFRQKLKSDSVALFYYAGHGMQVRGNNYLIPVDAEITTEATIGSEAVNVDTVLEQLTEAGSRVNLVILDACRNNPYERRFRSTGGGLASMDAPKGTLIAYATAPGKVAMDGEGANGLYTSELLRAIRKPGLQVEEVFKEVRIQVNRSSGDSQVPWESSSLTGQFYFTPRVEEPARLAPPPAPVTAQPAAGPDAATLELEAWRGAQRLDTEDAYRAYLQGYPQGKFVGLAKAAIAKLKQQNALRPEAIKTTAAPAKEKEADKQPSQIALAKPAPTAAPASQSAAPLPASPEPSSHRPTSRPTCRVRDDLANFFKDEGISVKVGTKLQFAKPLMSERIQVRVSGGVATLTGTVTSEEHATLAGKLAAEASGVNCVNNLLRVGAPDPVSTNPFGGN